MADGGQALRLAFVGQSTYFRACSADRHDAALETTFVEFRRGADVARMRAALDRFAPDVVVAWRPEVFPPGALADLPAVVVGFLTEPVPRDPDGRAHHPDLVSRARELAALDCANVDRLVSFDPLIAPSVERIMPVWRSLPIPVAERVYRPVRPGTDSLRPLFVGRSTPHRERFLVPVKREFDLLHVAFGAGVEELERLMDEHDVAINVHNEPYPSFENRVCLHLAAGHLIVSEPLSPSNGLRPGEDHLEVRSPEALVAVLRELREDPHAYDAVRVRGRERAEAFRADVVFEALARDAVADVAARGSHRGAVSAGASDSAPREAAA